MTDVSIQLLPDIALRMSRTESLNTQCDISDWRAGGYLSDICGVLQTM